jgi:hypothetical protein
MTVILALRAVSLVRTSGSNVETLLSWHLLRTSKSATSISASWLDDSLRDRRHSTSVTAITELHAEIDTIADPDIADASNPDPTRSGLGPLNYRRPLLRACDPFAIFFETPGASFVLNFRSTEVNA